MEKEFKVPKDLEKKFIKNIADQKIVEMRQLHILGVVRLFYVQFVVLPLQYPQVGNYSLREKLRGPLNEEGIS